MNWTLHLSVTGVLAFVLAGIAIYRKYMCDHEDHYIHLHDSNLDATVTQQQTSMAQRIALLDRAVWVTGTALVLYAVGVGVAAFYNEWTKQMG